MAAKPARPAVGPRPRRRCWATSPCAPTQAAHGCAPSAARPAADPAGLAGPQPVPAARGVPQETLDELATSIRVRGILQPILARTHPTQPDRFYIVAGERRWRAAGLAGLHEVPAIVREMSDAEAATAALIENLQREDLNPMEEAEGYSRLLDEFADHPGEAGRGGRQVALAHHQRSAVAEPAADGAGGGAQGHDLLRPCPRLARAIRTPRRWPAWCGRAA